MAQQTALDFFLMKLVDLEIGKTFYPNQHQDLQDAFRQAKQMEKEQHGKTWDKALDTYENRGHLYVRAFTDFDDYYNETYNK